MKKGLFTLLLLISTALPALAAPTNASGPWGIDIATFTNLSTAKRSPVTANKTMVITKTMSCNNLTIPADRAIDIKMGGKIRYSGNLVIKGPFNAGLLLALEKVGSGTVVFGSGAVPAVPVDWFNTNASPGITDMTAALASAINAAKYVAKIDFTADDYVINNVSLPATVGGTKAITFQGKGGFSISGLTPYGAGTKLIVNSAVSMFTPVNGANGYIFNNIWFCGNNKLGISAIDGGTLGSMFTINKCLFTQWQFAANLQMGLHEIMYSCFTDNTNALAAPSDGRVIGNHIIGNTGYGILTRGGTFYTNNEVANNTRGFWLDGTAGQPVLDIEIAGNYIENNSEWNIYGSGVSTGDRTLNKLKIHHNYIANISTGGAASGLVYIKNAHTVQLDGNNMIGSNGANTSETGGVVFENVDTSSISNLVTEQTYNNPVKIINSDDISISNLTARDYGFSTNPADTNYGVYVDATSNRITLNSIKLIDARGTSKSLGIKTWGPSVTIGSYYAYGGAIADSYSAGTYVQQFSPGLNRYNYTSLMADKHYVSNSFSADITITSGYDTPETHVTAPVGSIYLRTDGGTTNTLYVKTSGTGNTGWTAK